jgi:uncharacterized protein
VCQQIPVARAGDLSEWREAQLIPSNFFRRLYDGFFYHLLRLCRLRTASEKVARGFALGIIPHFFPTFGLGAVISAVFARACGGNGLAGLAGGALFTPLWPFLFMLNIKVGTWIFSDPLDALAVNDVSDVTAPRVEALVWGRDFSTGAILCAIVTALVCYLILVFVYERIRPSLLEWTRRRVQQRRRVRQRTRRLVPA